MDDPNKPVAGAAPGSSNTEHEAAVKAAAAAARSEGAAAATARLVAALGADGVKGDAVRMTAALDLAQKSPGMSGEDVAAFVVANVASQKADVDDAKAYEASRLAAAGQAQPGQGRAKKKATIDTSAIYSRRAKKEG